MLSLAALLLLTGQTPAADAPEPKDKLICRREVPIGSLIASRKVCLTKAQWVQREKDGNDAARKMADDNMGRPSCSSAASC
ncbi:hypothetical protein HJG53_02480 [Sphingomonas sp. ID1715]|uniref:hypothetical protein n=1 Tax=Sphingomonas sp. ID1715 TaxID=1656898 RepID=UPI001489AE47|nr:hypothetical protein [Sphingomonas sp. ID1715]NNM75773.1 hypothetical protein [Sphingomonas sp. ID1715]